MRAKALLVVIFLAVFAASDRVRCEDSLEWCVLESGAEVPPRWSEAEFDDSGWRAPADAINLHRDRGLLVRGSFVVSDPVQVTALSLELASHGPFTIFLNGIEVLDSPRPLPFSRDPLSGRVHGFVIDLDGVRDELLPGTNLLAIRVEGLVEMPRLRLELSKTGGPAREAVTRVEPKSSSVVIEPRGSIPRYVVLMICDGCGPQQYAAANIYTGVVPAYQSEPAWSRHWMTTFSAGSSYDGDLAWSDFSYPKSGATDSAAAATAMSCGSKTANGRISTNQAGSARFESIGEMARTLRFAVGALSTVPVTHATPGAFTSHNFARQYTFAIGDEALFGDPHTTGTPANDTRYGGSFGPTWPVTDVLIGARGDGYINALQRNKLAAESGLTRKHVLVEGQAGVDGGAALLEAASDPSCRMLAGLFDRVDLRVTAPGGGSQLDTPSLAETTSAALAVLERASRGFVLMVEGGAVDWASHANDMDRAVAEMLDFSAAVELVSDWVDEPSNGSGWDNTLVVVTADHETGYLTAAPGVFPNQPLAPGIVNDTTLALEKVVLDTGRRASWIDDNPLNDQIDEGETVHWAWNSGSHSNTLVPLFARGVGSGLLDGLATGVDPLRGAYIDNTAVFATMSAVLDAAAGIFSDDFELGNSSDWSGAEP